MTRQIFVVLGFYEGIIDEIKAFETQEEADSYEKELCKRYEIPFDQKERKKYYEEVSLPEYEVYQYVLCVGEKRK